jgi:hypothetical protein
VAHKAEFGKTQQEQELLETILVTVGKTLWVIDFINPWTRFGVLDHLLI